MNKTMLMIGLLGIGLVYTGPALAAPTDATIRAQGLEALGRLEAGMRASLDPESDATEPAGNVMKPAIYIPGGVGFSIDQDQDGGPRVPALRSF